jgi:hypothetical protein
MSPGAIYVDDIGPSATRYYWVRFVNTNDTPGPYNALVGTSATTGSDVTYTLGLLSGQITTTQLAAALNNRINLIDGSAATAGTIPNQLAFLQGQVDAITSYPDYAGGTTYATGDIVKYNGGLYKALSSTTGNLPTNATFWLKIGDYSSLADIVAAHTADIATLTTDLGGEVTAREALATQMRGGYTGTDLASVTTGLIFSERTARASADTGLASSISSVSATAAGKNRIFRQATAPSTPQVNDIWVDTKISFSESYFEQDFAKVKNKQYQWDGAAWLDITDVDIEDNFALVVREQTARATADDALAQDILTLNAGVNANDVAIRADLQVETTTRANADTALSSQITTLNSQVNNATTGLPVTRATLINDYSTTATVNTAIANSTTTLKAYTNTTASRTFRQNDPPTKRGVDGATDISLQAGDVWLDSNDLNKLYQWSGTAWVYSPDGAITASVTALSATLTTDYLTATDTENAIAQSATFLRAYADVQSKVFRQADAPTKRGVNSEPDPAVDIPLQTGDVWYDTNDSNKLYLWSGSAWVYSPDAVITGSVSTVDARVTTVEDTKIGYCTIGGLASDNTNKAACEAAGGTWTVGIPIATAVKQVSVSDGTNSATLETRATAQKTLNDGLQAQYFVKLDVNGNVAGYGVYADEGGSEFIANVDRFAVTTPQTSIQVRAISTTYATGAIARVAGADSKTLVCKIGGSTGTGAITVGAIGTLVTDGTVTWQVASRVPFAVQAVPTEINGQPVPAGVYIDAAYVLNATIQNAQIANEAVDDSKIASLNVGKLTAGSINVDDYIQSTGFVTGSAGWRITGNGTAEFDAAVIRGQLTASQINSNGLTIRTAAGAVILNAGTSEFSGNVTGTVAGTAASTLVTTANDAATAASAAQDAADDALDVLADIASDNVLTPGEKPTIITDYGVITAEQAGIDAQATAYAITTQKTAYDNAVTALTTHLGTLTTPVAWNNLSGNTDIVGTTFRTKFTDVYTTRQALLNAISAAAKVLADDAATAASTAQGAADAAQGTADDAVEAAAAAQDDADSALTGLTTKLNSDARNVLAGSGGLAVGTLEWNSSGVRTSGYGVGFSANGLAAYNSAGTATFALDGATGNATFAGALSAATGSFAGSLSAATGTFSGSLTADAVNAVNTINLAGSAVTVPVGGIAVGAAQSGGTLTKDLFTYTPATLAAGGSGRLIISLSMSTFHPSAPLTIPCLVQIYTFSSGTKSITLNRVQNGVTVPVLSIVNTTGASAVLASWGTVYDVVDPAYPVLYQITATSPSDSIVINNLVYAVLESKR